MTIERKYAEAIVIRWWEGVSTADEWEKDVREVAIDIAKALAEEREACANIVQERAHHHEAAVIRTEDLSNLNKSHRDRAEALRLAEAMIRERGR